MSRFMLGYVAHWRCVNMYLTDNLLSGGWPVPRVHIDRGGHGHGGRPGNRGVNVTRTQS